MPGNRTIGLGARRAGLPFSASSILTVPLAPATFTLPTTALAPTVGEYKTTGLPKPLEAP